MWQKNLADSLRDELELVLASVPNVAGLLELVKEPLNKARRGLFEDISQDRPWTLLPLLTCEALCGRYEHALPAATALQFLMAAGDVFDDVEDADSSESLSARYGAAIAINVATTLLILAEKAIVRLKDRDVADCDTIRVIDTVSSLYTTACAGQHLDLSLTPEIHISEDEYLKFTGMKSASQVECACRVGALLGSADQEFVDKFSAFGHNLGMAAQITNDIQGVTYGTDIMKRKLTLPIVFAMHHTESEVRSQLDITFSKQPESVIDLMQIRDLLFRTGAIHYATIKMESYKERALDKLSELEKLGAKTESLKIFIE